jgi:YceI-like domain
MLAGSGTHRLGPEQATLRVHTGRGGAAAKAGHDLVLEVGSWEATLDIAEDVADSSVELRADPTSLEVIEGSGGMQALGDEDKANIVQTIDDQVLEGKPVSFRSASATPLDHGIRFEGELVIGAASGVVGFDLAVGDDGGLDARATVRQSDWGIKPYSALFGALKVKDEVEVVLEGHL